MARGASARVNRSQRRAAAGVSKAPSTTSPANGSNSDTVVTEMVSGEEALVASSSGGTTLPVAAATSERVLEVLTAAGVPDTRGIAPTYELTQGSLADLRFNEIARADGLTEMSDASWPCEADLEDTGTTLFRDGNTGVYRLADGTIVQVGIRYGWLHARYAATKRSALAAANAAFSSMYPPLYRQAEDNASVVPITFWSDSKWGPTSRLRMIDSATWTDIERNYAGDVQAELGRLMGDEFTPGEGGQLLLWQGPPGSGKTFALRALASEWRDWAEFHYITDPDAFFVANPSYMIDVLLSDTYEEFDIDQAGDIDVVTSVREGGKWRVLILEDTGELLAANAKEAYGQGLSRLLNVVDGMVGQGLRVLALVTTNDELDELHPAVVRPGRCASQLEFGPLSADEATAWLGPDTTIEVEAPHTLAELYHLAGGDPETAFQTGVGECTCGHMDDQHDPQGACTIAGCSCVEYTDAGAVTAAGDVFLDLQRHLTANLVTPYTEQEIADRLRLVFSDIQIADVIPPEQMPRSEVPPRAPTPAAPEPPDTTLASMKRWTATLCPEGLPTDDGRMFAEGSISWRDLPLSLMAMLETADGHDGAHVAGRIDEIWREGAVVKASGVFDESEFGDEIARMVADGVLRGVSVDIAIRKWEIGYRSDLEPEGATPEPADGDPDLVDMLYGADDLLFVVTDGVIGAVTVCPFPAFADASIALAASLVASIQSPALWTYTAQAGYVVTSDPADVGEAITASVALAEGEPVAPDLVVAGEGIAPVAPPADWFDNPALEELTALVVGEDGRVFGHLAAWDTCHLGFDVCTVAPHSNLQYSYFHLGEVLCEDGESVACGKITLGTGHADTRLGFRAAISHYDDTGTVVADVCAGEDEHGIWVAGALRPHVDIAAVRELRAAPLSGDWRNINGNLELVAALAVNVPGFPVPRVRAIVASSEEGDLVLALVAAGVHDGHQIIGGFTDEALREISTLAAVASGDWASELDALAARARG